MRSLQSVVLAATMCLTGCGGGVVIGAAIDPYHAPVTVCGVISIVQVTTITSSGGPASFVTVVTFLQTGTASTVNFCGNVGDQFVMNTFTTVNFTQGQTCGTIVAVSTG